MASYAISPSGDVVLMLTKAEARALSTCAGEGAEGLLHDRAAASAYIGGPAALAAARRALDALGEAAAISGGARQGAAART